MDLSNLNNNELDKLLSALRKSYARKNLIDFTGYTFDRYQPNWHHYLIADRLEMLATGKIKRLIINMPPRHGKSELVSIRFPAWYLGNKPHKHIIATSYNASLAADFGKKARNVVASIEFKEVFRHAKLSEESAAKLNWTLEESFSNKPCPSCGSINWQKKAFGRAICKSCGALGEFAGSRTLGAYYGAGVGGGITGKGADLLIVDDPVKDRKEAQSEVYRKNVWDWFTSAAYPRLQGDSLVCICQTRWHEDDLTGKVINYKFGDEPWHVLSLKAIAEEDEEYEIFNPDYIEALGTNKVFRSKGEALWASQFPIKRLLEFKAGSSYEFNAQYQQSPQPASGGLFKRHNARYADQIVGGYYNLHDGPNTKVVSIANCYKFATMDLAYKEKESADYTVIATWLLTPDNDLILDDIYRERIDGAEHMNLIWQVFHKNHPSVIIVEDYAYQTSLLQTAVNNGLPAQGLGGGKGDKFTKAIPIAGMFEMHKVFFNRNIPIIDDILYELATFPTGKNDDIVDVCSFAGLHISNIALLKSVPLATKDRNIPNFSNKRQFYKQL